MNKRLIITLSLFCCFFISCVSKSKYEELLQVKDYLEQENKAIADLEADNRNWKSQNQQLQNQLKKAEQDFKDLELTYNSLSRNYQDLASRYNKIIDDNRQIVDVSANEKRFLEEELARKQLELEEKKRELQFLEEGLSQREQKVQELSNLLAAKDAQMAAIRDRLNQALTGFRAEDLSVTERDGKIYVSLSQNLLFRSGSAYIDSKGKRAIRQLAQVLSNHADIDINVEGHTDSDGTPHSNWDLSVRRAVSVVKQLTASGLDARRVVASGRGENMPIAPNSTQMGKAQNRRTEIILSPKLEALYDILNSDN
jgi:chemotaxis protein MotB